MKTLIYWLKILWGFNSSMFLMVILLGFFSDFLDKYLIVYKEIIAEHPGRQFIASLIPAWVFETALGYIIYGFAKQGFAIYRFFEAWGLPSESGSNDVDNHCNNAPQGAKGKDVEEEKLD